MRSFAKHIITQAAVRAAGIEAAQVMDKPARENITLPEKRIQLEYLQETLVRKFKRVARFKSRANPETHRTVRSRIYEATLTVRAEVKSNDEAWLESFARRFLVELPRKAADPDNNLVTIAATRAVRGGFQSRTVDVFKRRSNALYISFKGMVCKDRDVPLIRDINFKDPVNYEEKQ